MSYSLSRIHERNMKVYKLQQTSPKKHSRRKASFKLNLGLKDYLYISLALIVLTMLITKTVTDMSGKMVVYADTMLLSPVPKDFNPYPTTPVKSVEKQVKVEKSQKEQILAYLVEKFGNDAADAITMIRKCENSSFNQEAKNYNRNSTVDYGVMQINSIHDQNLCKDLDFRNSWKDNIDCGYRVYKDAGYKFRPWTCAYEVGQENYLANN